MGLHLQCHEVQFKKKKAKPVFSETGNAVQTHLESQKQLSWLLLQMNFSTLLLSVSPVKLLNSKQLIISHYSIHILSSRHSRLLQKVMTLKMFLFSPALLVLFQAFWILSIEVCKLNTAYWTVLCDLLWMGNRRYIDYRCLEAQLYNCLQFRD